MSRIISLFAVPALLAAALLLCGGAGDCLVGAGGEPDTDGAAYAVSSSVALSEEEKALVAYLVSVEAEGYPYETMVCLSAVILNRLSEDSFPRGIRGVVFDSGDFEAVTSGQVSGQPPHAHTLLRGYSLAMRALEEAMEGVDPTGGALYFTKDGTSALHSTVRYRCGGMLFYL